MTNWYNKNLIKTASYDYKGQDIDTQDLADAQRYVLDSYVIKIAKTKNNNKITASLLVTNGYFGEIIWNYYLIFDKNEEGKANSAYKHLKAVTKTTLAQFVEEEIPTSLIHAYIRADLHDYMPEHIAKTHIPIQNYARSIPPVKDWRQSLYGNRYPEYKEKSFKQGYEEDNKNTYHRIHKD